VEKTMVDPGKHDAVGHAAMPAWETAGETPIKRNTAYFLTPGGNLSGTGAQTARIDINQLELLEQLEAGTVRVEIARFPVNDVFERLREEVAPQAHSQGLALRVVPCALSIDGDPRLLEQMIRIVLSNALGYAERGKILLGCRRHGGMLSIEVRTTGNRVLKSQLQTIVKEYLHLESPARERNHGLRFGLATVTRLGDLMGYRVVVRSRPGLGSAFAIKVGRSREVARQGCVHVDKPTAPRAFTQAVHGLGVARQSSLAAVSLPYAPAVSASPDAPVIIVVGGDQDHREGLRDLFGGCGWYVESFSTCEAFIDAYRLGLDPYQLGLETGHQGRDACVLVDADLPPGGLSGLGLLRWLGASAHRLPAIMIAGKSDVSMAVQAMKAGATDVIQAPVCHQDVLASINSALERSRESSRAEALHETAANSISSLTLRQRQILDLVLSGQASKTIAADLGISQRTVENHRAAIMKRTGTRTLPALTRLALAASSKDPGRERRV